MFIPGLANLELVERICRAVPVPVNAMHLPGGPSRAEWANAGIARVSHGPFPYMAMQQWLDRRSARGSRLSLSHSPPVGARPGLQNRLAEQPRTEPQDHSDPQDLPGDGHECGQRAGC